MLKKEIYNLTDLFHIFNPIYNFELIMSLLCDIKFIKSIMAVEALVIIIEELFSFSGGLSFGISGKLGKY